MISVGVCVAPSGSTGIGMMESSVNLTGSRLGAPAPMESAESIDAHVRLAAVSPDRVERPVAAVSSDMIDFESIDGEYGLSNSSEKGLWKSVAKLSTNSALKSVRKSAANVVWTSR